MRSSLIGSLRSDFVRTARAKGLTERTVILRHALRNSANAALSMTGLQAGLMFAGVVVIETVFGWPGIGLYVAQQSIPAADFPGDRRGDDGARRRLRDHQHDRRHLSRRSPTPG